MRVAFLALVMAVIGLVTGMWIGGHPENLPAAVSDVFVESELVPDQSASDEAAGIIDAKYWRKTDATEVQDSSIRGMVDQLKKQYKDRFSHYFDADELTEFNESIDGAFSGVGMTVGEAGKEGLRIGFVFKRSPAADAGFQPGDVIVTVDGESIRGETADLAVARIKGPEGSEVTLGVKKGGEGALKDFTLTREEIRVPITSNRVKTVDGQKLGYVRLTSFTSGAGVSLRRAVDKARENGAEGIVIDLRANGGGLLPEAVLTSSIFLPEGDVVVKTVSRTQPTEVYKAIGDDIGPFPLTVLVDRDTASSAEILAAALQTGVKAPVVGTRTYGKGVFQQVIDLDSGGALDLTVGEFFTADGVSLAGKGLKPDVKAPLAPDARRDTQLDKAYEVLGDEIAAAGGGSQ